jgi:phosphatidylserine/phosphatidylglycerophosphate/cardiolipin synthase-like enzyme
MGLLLLDNSFLPQAQNIITEARQSIDISTFKAEITHKPRGQKLLSFFELLLLRAKQGVKIRFLINWHNDRRSVAKTNLYVMSMFKKNGVRLRHLRNNRCCHAKLILADKKKAIVGSHNLSVKSCHNNFEISYLVPDPETTAEISRVFERSWYDAEEM